MVTVLDIMFAAFISCSQYLSTHIWQEVTGSTQKASSHISHTSSPSKFTLLTQSANINLYPISNMNTGMQVERCFHCTYNLLPPPPCVIHTALLSSSSISITYCLLGKATFLRYRFWFISISDITSKIHSIYRFLISDFWTMFYTELVRTFGCVYGPFAYQISHV